MSGIGFVQAGGGGEIVRVGQFAHEYEQHKDAPDAAVAVLVALTPANITKLRDIADDVEGHSIVAGVVKKGADAVTFEPGDDAHAAEKFLRGLTTAQRNGLRAGAKAVVTGLNAGSSDVEKAIGWLVVRSLEDR